MTGPCSSRLRARLALKASPIPITRRPASTLKPRDLSLMEAIDMGTPKEPTILVIFGCMGDLAWRKLAPALYNLHLGKLLPEKFSVIGLDMKPGSAEDFRQRLKDGAKTFCECGDI